MRECFDYAFRTHRTTFPVSAYDLKAAWAEIDKTVEIPQWKIDQDACTLCDENGYVLNVLPHKVCKHK